MSSDETATIIGRMMLERKDLTQQDVALSEELSRIGEGLGILGRKLRGAFSRLEPEHTALLDAEKISGLVSDLAKVRERLQELNEGLERSGL